jgi:ABC-type transporter MlaC component
MQVLQEPDHPDKTKRFFTATFAALALSATLLAMPAAKAKAPTGQEKHVRTIATQVISLAKSGVRGTTLHGRFVNLLSRYANMNTVGRFALGRYRSKLPASQKAKYNKLVKAYIAGLFVYYAKDFRGKRFEIRSSHPSGKSVIIDSRIVFSSKTTPVKWRVYSSGSRHRVTDVNIRGVWMSIQMRQKFTQILKRNKGDFNALLAFLGTYKNWMPKG